jgi:transposase
VRRQTGIVHLTEEERRTLHQWTRVGKNENRLVERARVILLADEGCTNRQIAERLNTRTARVSKWRQRFAAQRLQGLQDARRSGKPVRYDESTEKRILALLDEAPPKGYAQWNGSRLAEKLGDVSKAQVWRVLRRRDICLQRGRSWCISTDPDLAPKPPMWWVCI